MIGPQDRDYEKIEEKELIDILHKSLILWSRSEKDKLLELLKGSGYGEKEFFYRVAQAISECLPIDSKEKKWLDGFLIGRERVKDEMKRKKQKELF